MTTEIHVSSNSMSDSQKLQSSTLPEYCDEIIRYISVKNIANIIEVYLIDEAVCVSEKINTLETLSELLAHNYNKLRAEVTYERTGEGVVQWYKSMEGKNNNDPRCWGSVDVAMFTQFIQEISLRVTEDQKIENCVYSMAFDIPRDISNMILEYLPCSSKNIIKAIKLINLMTSGDFYRELSRYINIKHGRDDFYLLYFCKGEIAKINNLASDFGLLQK